jgi:hypothetical protein
MLLIMFNLMFHFGLVFLVAVFLRGAVAFHCKLIESNRFTEATGAWF